MHPSFDRWCKHGVSVVAVLCNLSKLPTNAAAKKADKGNVETLMAKKKKIDEGLTADNKGKRRKRAKASKNLDTPEDHGTERGNTGGHSNKPSSNVDLKRITATLMYEWANEVIACQKRGGGYKDSMKLQEIQLHGQEEAAKELSPPEPRVKKLAQHHVGAVISKTSNSKGGRRTASSAAKDIIMSDEDYRKLLAPLAKKSIPQHAHKLNNAVYDKLQKALENSANACQVVGRTKVPEEAQTVSLQDEALMLLLESDSETDDSRVKIIGTKPEMHSISTSSCTTIVRQASDKQECTLDELLDF